MSTGGPAARIAAVPASALEQNLAAVRDRIAAAARAAGRDPADVRLLADLGVEAVGENRHQEAEA